MANKLKKSTTPVAEKPEKPAKAETTKPAKAKASDKLKKDKEESVDFKKLARDERTWKILGTISLLSSIFLFIAFTSYLFTWKEDQSQVLNKGVGFLFNHEHAEVHD